MNRSLLYKYFEGLASYEDEVILKQWLDKSPENRISFNEERKQYDMMLLTGEKVFPVIEMKKKTRYSLTLELMKIAAIVLLVFGGSHWYYQRQMDEKLSRMQSIFVPSGQRINFTLPDGTNVWLNSRTTMQYPVAFTKKERKVLLAGEAYFEVKKDEKIPFIVQTKNHKVEVLGTKFDVEAYEDAEDFETTLMEGSVKVVSIKDPTDALVLIPETKAYLVGGRLQAVAVDEFNHYRWKEGLICFKNESFSKIMRDFEKYYGIMIKIESSRVNKHTYTGKFRQTDGVEYALRVLQKDIRFTYQRDDDNHVIYIK